MKLYNTRTRQIEEVTSLGGQPASAKPKIGLYACGPTVYDYTHIGHLRKYAMDDVLVRTLRQEGFRVSFVQNITDVGHLSSDGDTGEDKLEKGAKKYGKSAWDVAKEFEEYYWRSMQLMHNLKPDVSCRATDHIEQQLEMVKTLEKKGFTYVIEDDGVYFDTSKLDDYGALAKLDAEQLKEGARLGVVEGKRNPTDFALWKFERPGENRAMVWESPWAERSFPGWHIECSAMSMEYLGDQFEIHTGGIDHIPVHHPNEIAQAEAATGKKPFVKLWFHHNFLQIDGEKMAKSLGNFYTIDDILERGFDPMALKLLFLSTHYRSEMNFTWEALEASQTAWQKLVKLVYQLREQVGGETSENATFSDQTAKDYLGRFTTAMQDDLNTAQALAALWETTKDSTISPRTHLSLVMQFDSYFGLGLDQVEYKSAVVEDHAKLPKEVQSLLSQRSAARAEQNWQLSDQLRDQLGELGYAVTDADGEQVVERSYA